VQSNWIGTDVAGMLPLGNAGTGVVLAEGTHDNDIRWNVISANGANGVDLTGNYFTSPPASTDRNQFTGNTIGLAMDGVTPMGNGGRGVSLGIFEINSFYAGFCRQNTFTSNAVAWNGMAGFSVWEHPSTGANADENTFLSNIICDNASLGIDLGDDGVTLNDPLDPDGGANQELNYPAILTATCVAGATTVTGTVDGGCQVHLYRAKPDPSGYGEGDFYAGSTSPDPLGNWTLTVAGLVVGDWVTAIGMDWVSGVCSNTSEFSTLLQVQSGAGGIAGEPKPGFRLALAGPNPFHSGTAFRCLIPGPGDATLRIFDVEGRLVRALDPGNGGGFHDVAWDGRGSDGAVVPSGIYLVELRAGASKGCLKVVKAE
jgi:hypothetical protein